MTELTERLNIRVTLEQKEALFRCAMKRGETLSAYLVRRGLEEESRPVMEGLIKDGGIVLDEPPLCQQESNQ